VVDVNYERMEFMGDSILKLAATEALYWAQPYAKVEELTYARTRVVRNVALAGTSVSNNIPRYIRSAPFSPRHWVAPGLDPSDSVWSKRLITPAVVADVMEALICAYHESGGRKRALEFMRLIGMEILPLDAEQLPPLPPVTLSRIPLSALTEELAGRVDSVLRSLPKLEETLGYTFENKALLAQALHAGLFTPDVFGDYQRLEFLGDAVHDALVTEYIYVAFPDLSPGDMTFLRQSLVGNRMQAQAAVKAGLDGFLIHFNPSLDQVIAAYKKAIQEEKDRRVRDSIESPKVLSDLFEAVLGAVYVDSGRSLATCWQVLSRLMPIRLDFARNRVYPDL